MDTVKTKTPGPLSPPVATCSPETRAVLDDFFRSFGFATQGELSRLAAWSGSAGRTPEAALDCARARMETWLRGVLEPQPGGGPVLARGRAAFVLCDGARWGAGVLEQGARAAPAELARALRAALPVPTPRPLPTSMPAQSLVLWPLGESFRRWWRAGEPDMSLHR